MPESARPRNPSPAATGMASASSPMRIARVMPSMSAPFPRCAVLEVADLVLDLLLGRACADQLRHRAPVALHREPERCQKKDHTNQNERRETRNPDRLWNDGRGFQRRLTTRAGGPRLRHDTKPVPGDQRKECDQQHQRRNIERKPQLLRKQYVERIDADVRAV